MTMPSQPGLHIDAQRMVRLTADAGALGYAEVVAQLGQVLAVNETQAAVIDQLRQDLAAESAEKARLAYAVEELQARVDAAEQASGEDDAAEPSP